MTENKKGRQFWILESRCTGNKTAHKSQAKAWDEMQGNDDEIRVIEYSSYRKAVDALRKISSEDFRGNRPQSSVDAYNALKELGEI